MKYILITILSFFMLCAQAKAPKTAMLAKQKFIKQMVQKYHFDKAKLRVILAKAKYNPAIIKKMNHPFESEPWYQYREHFLNQSRIKLGVKYWQEHKAALKLAEKKYGLPAEIIVAIIGVETKYGEFLGKYSILNALDTLAFYYPKRAKFFQYELAQYLLLTKEEHLDPTKLHGSYAGAMGYGQFMPSSYRIYAVSFSKHSTADLMHDTNAVISSIANYLQKKGWHRNKIITTKAIVTGKKYKKILTNDLEPKLTLKQLAKYNIKSIKKLLNSYQATLIPLKTKTGLQFWLGFHNFYVITHYNANYHYAMAVYQLGKAIKHEYTATSH